MSLTPSFFPSNVVLEEAGWDFVPVVIRQGSSMVPTSQAEEVLARVAGGDRSAFDDCIEAYGNLVWGIVAKFFANAQDREDVVQDVFLSLWKNAYRFDQRKGSEKTFIAVITRRRIIDHLRRRERETAHITAVDAEINPVGVESSSQLVDRQDEANFVLAAMGELRHEERQVLQLAILQGMSHSRIADRMKLPLGTVKTLARRGMIRLRDLVKQSSQAQENEIS